MTAPIRPTEPLRRDADPGHVVDAVNALIAKLDERERVSPSIPLDAADPSASIVYTDEEYDSGANRLQAPAAPNERLRQTLLSRSPRQ